MGLWISHACIHASDERRQKVGRSLALRLLDVAVANTHPLFDTAMQQGNSWVVKRGDYDLVSHIWMEMGEWRSFSQGLYEKGFGEKFSLGTDDWDVNSQRVRALRALKKYDEASLLFDVMFTRAFEMGAMWRVDDLKWWRVGLEIHREAEGLQW